MNLDYIPSPYKILDIGANVGDFAVMCKHKWSATYIHCIEANENCESRLQVVADKYTIALLGDKNHTSCYYTDRNNPHGQGNSIYKEIVYDQYDVVYKPMVTLDSIITEEFDLIKIDTQGSELNIINGGIKTLKRAKYVLLELSLIPYNHNAPLYPTVVERMMDLGFMPYHTLNLCRVNNRLIQTDLLFFNTSKMD